jgi:hypothetical protein
MANFDPLMRRETWCFQRNSAKTYDGKECMQLLPFKFVEYDGSPDRYIEPVNLAPYHKAALGSAAPANMFEPVNPMVDGTVVSGFEIFDSVSTLFGGVHRFGFI